VPIVEQSRDMEGEEEGKKKGDEATCHKKGICHLRAFSNFFTVPLKEECGVSVRIYSLTLKQVTITDHN
jgi:hypothetical protein